MDFNEVDFNEMEKQKEKSSMMDLCLLQKINGRKKFNRSVSISSDEDLNN